LLLVVDDGDNMKVYIDRPFAISEAIIREPKKKWNLPKLAANPVLVYDEAKRMLVIVSVPGSRVCKINRPLDLTHVQLKVFLDVFVFDPTAMSLTSRGSRIELTNWYEATPTFQAGCFVSGKEEIFLLEKTGRGRIFSLITEQFRSFRCKPLHLQSY
jgi:hypothetical protein